MPDTLDEWVTEMRQFLDELLAVGIRADCYGDAVHVCNMVTGYGSEYLIRHSKMEHVCRHGNDSAPDIHF